MKYKDFKELPVWQAAIEVTKIIYDLSANSKWSKDFGLRDQIRRAVVSISSNVVEGFEKNNNNEFIRFLRMSKGSAGETRNQLHIGFAVGHITQKEFEETDKKLEGLAGQIGGLIMYLDKYRKNNP